jgi:hypothetical protein
VKEQLETARVANVQERHTVLRGGARVPKGLILTFLREQKANQYLKNHPKILQLSTLRYHLTHMP